MLYVRCCMLLNYLSMEYPLAISISCSVAPGLSGSLVFDSWRYTEESALIYLWYTEKGEPVSNPFIFLFSSSWAQSFGSFFQCETLRPDDR